MKTKSAKTKSAKTKSIPKSEPLTPKTRATTANVQRGCCIVLDSGARYVIVDMEGEGGVIVACRMPDDVCAEYDIVTFFPDDFDKLAIYHDYHD